MSKYVKIYLLWFIPVLSIGYGLKYIYEPLTVLTLLFSIFVPSDRIRMKMIKAGHELPTPKLSWQLVGLCSLIPFTFGVYSSAVADLAADQHRANAIVMGVVFWGVFTFSFNCMLFKNKAYWRNTSQRITK